MLTVYRLKPALQQVLRPSVAWLARRGITANQVTVAALVLCFAYGAALALRPASSWLLILLPAVCFVRMALNAMDGMVAREHGQTSRLGTALNELGDVAGDAALYLPLALVPGFSPALIVVLVVLAALTEMAGILTQAMGHGRSYRGPMGKSDRAAVLGALGFIVGVGVVPGTWLDLVLSAVLVLLALTIVNRVRDGLKEPG